jgi:antitoxin MazE
MKVDLVRIGNSRGIRIPKPLIEQCGLGDTVELQVERDRLIISAQRQPREGWEEAFQTVGLSTNDELLLDATEINEFDRKEWHW